MFDLIVGIEEPTSEQEREAVKAVARQLLLKLKEDRLVLDWRKKQQARAAVRQAIRAELDALPEHYDSGEYEDAVNAVYGHVYEAYRGRDENIYA